MTIYRLTESERAEWESRLTDPSRPVLVGAGEAEFATTTALEPWPSLIWDVNSYYYTLGVSRHAPKREIKDRFIEADGHGSTKFTSIAKVLLNDELRRLYDLMPMGSTFIDDDVVSALYDHLIQEQAKDGPVTDDDPVIDLDSFRGELHEAMREALERDPTRDIGWSHYLWKCDVSLTLGRAAVLSEWRAALSSAISASPDCTTRGLGVGFIGDMIPVQVVKVGYRMVALLGVNEHPSEVLAWEAVHQLVDAQLK